MTPAQWFAKMRLALATPGQSAEWVAFQSWWAQQQRHHRRAWFHLAGIPDTQSTRPAWGELRPGYRAAIVGAVGDTRASLAGITSAIDAAAPVARAYLDRAAA